MKHKWIAFVLGLVMTVPFASAKDAAASGGKKAASQAKGAGMSEKVVKSDEEWKKLLSPTQFEVARQKGTERAFTGEYWNNHKDGKYYCVCCGAELFTSDNKFDSHCGWPSFYKTAESAPVAEHVDKTHGMVRTEVICDKCGAH